MPAWLLPLLPTIAEKLPAFFMDIVDLMHSNNGTPTDDQWNALIASTKKTYGFEEGH